MSLRRRGYLREAKIIPKKKKALEKLKKTRELNTSMLKALGIPFEFFLKFGQLSDAKANQVMDKLIKQLEKMGV